MSSSQLSGPGKNNQEIETNACFTDNGTKYLEQNSYWYYGVCGKAGKLTFDLISSDAGGDLDFTVYEVNGNICTNRTIVRCTRVQDQHSNI